MKTGRFYPIIFRHKLQHISSLVQLSRERTRTVATRVLIKSCEQFNALKNLNKLSFFGQIVAGDSSHFKSDVSATMRSPRPTGTEEPIRSARYFSSLIIHQDIFGAKSRRVQYLSSKVVVCTLLQEFVTAFSCEDLLKAICHQILVKFHGRR